MKLDLPQSAAEATRALPPTRHGLIGWGSGRQTASSLWIPVSGPSAPHIRDMGRERGDAVEVGGIPRRNGDGKPSGEGLFMRRLLPIPAAGGTST